MLRKTKAHLFVFVVFFVLAYPGRSFAQSTAKPNVILIVTDDQGYGDFGITGNRHVKTPVIDALARESVRLNNFYVSPVCAPTRASLMTGRYGLRTGIRDTYNGGAVMASTEITIAEMLKDNGYHTGIFGKWHLGDNYPYRPSEQGFDESVVHLSGGMGQVGDITTYFKGDSSYFNPTLWHNGERENYSGYCSDIFATQAIDFIERSTEKPFFCYLAFNAPHTPLQVPKAYYDMYKNIDPATGFDADKRPFPKMSQNDKEDARKIYGMVTNIDDNMGRLLNKLDELKISDNTLLIFMTDNGPQQYRYVGGMRGRKGSVYRGGVRVPCFIRLPSRLRGNQDIETTTAHIDMLPTIAAICDANVPRGRPIDGRNLLPLLQGETVDWHNRPLFFYWTRRYPELYNNMALQQGAFKLVGHANYNAQIQEFELFNIATDPYEETNLVDENESVALDLKRQLDTILHELNASDNLISPPRLIIGNKQENPVILNRNDADGERGIWAQEEIFGKWNVHITKGRYNIKFKFIEPVSSQGIMYLETPPIVNQLRYTASKSDVITMKNVDLPTLDCDLIPFYMVDEKRIFPFYVELEKLD